MIQFIVDAFSDKVFSGNPAAVCICDYFPEDKLMQEIAKENRLSETAFIKDDDGEWSIRWFTPSGEVDLCGHATLASAFVLGRYYGAEGEIVLNSPSGVLKATIENDTVMMNFPSRPGEAVNDDKLKAELEEIIGCRILEIFKARDYLILTDCEEAVRNLSPSFEALRKIDMGKCGGFIVTARDSSGDFDFVSRCFYPVLGINEDPVTGSAHCMLIPFWAERLGKKELSARQLSERGGKLVCADCGERVIIGGEAAVYSVGDILTEEE